MKESDSYPKSKPAVHPAVAEDLGCIAPDYEDCLIRRTIPTPPTPDKGLTEQPPIRAQLCGHMTSDVPRRSDTIRRVQRPPKEQSIMRATVADHRNNTADNGVIGNEFVKKSPDDRSTKSVSCLVSEKNNFEKAKSRTVILTWKLVCIDKQADVPYST